MIIIAIVNLKGGPGKTTTAVNLSVALGMEGKEVLLIDLDPQANATYSFGISPSRGTISDILESKKYSPKLFKSMIEKKEGIDIMPSSRKLADVEIRLVNEKGREKILSKKLRWVKGYDFVFLDCPPSLSLLTLNALNFSHQVIIPMQMEILSLIGLFEIIDKINEVNKVFKKKISIRGIVPTVYDKRRNLTREVESEIKNITNAEIFTPIRRSVRVSESPSFARSVLAYAPRCNASLDYMNLARQFIKRKGGLCGNRK